MHTLVLTHGGLARELVAAAQMISGDSHGIEALSLDWNDGIEEGRRKVARALEHLDNGDGVLILTDMFGGTPCNVAQSFQRPGRIEIVSGVNLPMVLRLACGCATNGRNPAEMARWLREKGRESVRLADGASEAGPRAETPCD